MTVTHTNMFVFIPTYKTMGQDSVVGIGIHCGLDGLAVASKLGQNFLHPSRPALGPTQPPIQWVLRHFLG
jgi:hypothetical protein